MFVIVITDQKGHFSDSPSKYCRVGLLLAQFVDWSQLPSIISWEYKFDNSKQLYKRSKQLIF